MQSTARQVGSALGVAILGTVLFTTTGGVLAASLDDAGVPSAAADKVVTAVVDSAGAAIAGLEADPAQAQIADAARTAFSDGTRASALTAAGFLAIGLGATFALGSGRRRDDEAQESRPAERVHGS